MVGRGVDRIGLFTLLEKGMVGIIGRMGKAAIYSLDALLRRWHHVQEFTSKDGCLLRIALGRSERNMTLSDGTGILRGERIGELHLWNEHIPPMPEEGPDLRWGLTFYRRWMRSLEELAAYVENEPTFKDIRAFRGEVAFVLDGGSERYAKLLRQWGFDFIRAGPSRGRLRRFGEFWENVYSWGLMWAFNPGSLRRKGLLRLERCQLWISRQVLLQKYGRDSGASGLKRLD